MTSTAEYLKEDGCWRGSEANSVDIEAVVESRYEGEDNVCFAYFRDAGRGVTFKRMEMTLFEVCDDWSLTRRWVPRRRTSVT